jgi:tetratricopeptide (TPR) repeat protein
MVVDPRRDHSFRVPQPMLSALLNTPNACTGCHQDKSDAWAKTALQKWLGHQPLRDEHASTLAIARSNNPAALQALLELANNPGAATIIRATAVQESGRFPATETLTQAIEHLYSEQGLIRLAAVRALDILPPDQRYTLLNPLIADPLKSVRMAVATALAGVPTAQLDEAQSRGLKALFSEYQQAMALNADMPSAQLNLGAFYTENGQQQRALEAYQHALKLSPGYLPAMLNLADLYRSMGQDDKARPLLLQVIDQAPQQAPAYHALGLLLVRQKQVDQSLAYLEKASHLAPEVARYSYVYGVALHSSGRREDAIEVLTEAAQQHPYDRQIQGALEAYRQQP